MRKYLFIIPIAIIFLFASIITYLNFFGIKTDKFNKLIYSKISQINPKLSSEINDVFIKLDIKTIFHILMSKKKNYFLQH